MTSSEKAARERVCQLMQARYEELANTSEYDAAVARIASWEKDEKAFVQEHEAGLRELWSQFKRDCRDLGVEVSAKRVAQSDVWLEMTAQTLALNRSW